MRGIATLDRKLMRDLWRIKGQALAIALVIGAGVAVFVVMLSALDSLQLTLDTYYQRYRFGDVFASLKRAPLGVMDEILEIPGVEYAEPRVVVDVTIDVPGFDEPATGRLVSIPADGRPGLCDVHLTEGDYIRPGHPEEVIVDDTFANAHRLRPGDSFAAVINGRRRELRIRARAYSPEFVYNVRPGELMPDDKRFGPIWMERRALASAYQMEGGFNDVVLKLQDGASEQEVIDRLDRILKRYGGIGAIPRRLQLSNWYLQSELTQLEGMGTTLPVIFLGVAAFLLNVALTRIIALQREQIAAIKALGYSNRQVGWHYIKLSLGVATAGAFIGIGAGMWLGRAMVEMYADFFHFPILLYMARRETLLLAVAISMAAAAGGALMAVRRAVGLAPAEAMRPAPPATYKASPIEKGVFKRLLSQPSRMIVRSLHRNPVRALLSLTGVAFGVTLLILGTFSMDAIKVLTDFQFNVAQRYDMTVTFAEPASARALYELQGMPGVIAVEEFRSVPVRLRHGHRHRNISILGLPPEPELNRIVDASWSTVDVPPDGLALSGILAELLALRPGDRVVVEVLEGQQPVLDVAVSAVVEDYMGMNVYMNADTLRQLMQEGGTISGAWLRADPAMKDRLYRQLKNTPAVAGVSLKTAAMESFESTMGELMGRMRAIYTIFAGIIAFGVVYNSARISLSERARELATLRVIGFTKGEVSYILLGEMAIVTLLALPLGVALGHLSATALIESLDSEVYRFPAVVTASTSMVAALSVFAAAVLSGLIVRRKLDHLNLVESLKIRE